MKDKQVFFKEYENSFATNETLFTTNFSEFQGVSMFTSRRHTFLVTEEDFVKIKEYLKIAMDNANNKLNAIREYSEEINLRVQQIEEQIRNGYTQL